MESHDTTGPPARFSHWLATGCAGLVVGVVALGSGGSLTVLGPAVAGAVGIGLGPRRRSDRLLSLGVVGLVGGVLGTAFGSAPAVLILVGMGGAVVAWDLGEQAMNVGAQLGPEAATYRLEAVHAAVVTILVLTPALLTYAIYLVSSRNQPPLVVALLVLASFLLLSVLRK